jgi:hypothetical protein
MLQSFSESQKVLHSFSSEEHPNGIHHPPMATRLLHRSLSHPWLPVFGVAVFSLGMAAGILRSTEIINNDIVSLEQLFFSGRVAGASVGSGTGTASLSITGASDPASYAVKISEPVSLYTLFRLAERQSFFSFTLHETKNGAIDIEKINGELAPVGMHWEYTKNDEPLDDINAPVILPGDAVSVSAAR